VPATAATAAAAVVVDLARKLTQASGLLCRKNGGSVGTLHANVCVCLPAILRMKACMLQHNSIRAAAVAAGMGVWATALVRFRCTRQYTADCQLCASQLHCVLSSTSAAVGGVGVRSVIGRLMRKGGGAWMGLLVLSM
jgi:hypothetical protein